MPRFFALTQTPDTRKSLAFAETVEARYDQEPIRCSACGRPIANLRWLPPFRVWLKNPRIIPDLIQCFGGPDLLVSHRLHDELRHARLKGIDRSYPVQVTRVATRRTERTPPALFGVDLVHSYCRVDFAASGVTWSTPPEEHFCSVCGPGGGGGAGCFWSFERLVFDISGWDGEEIFLPINLPGTPILTEDGISKLDFGLFTNCRIIPADRYRFEYGRVA
jgi:hypothetical protein